MKRLLILAALTLMVASIALAATTAPYTPPGALVDTYTLVDGVWTNFYIDPDLGEMARAFTSGDSFSGNCNKFVWGPFTFTNHASIAQWTKFNLSASRWDWQVRKWGTFAADCLTFNIQSNGDVTIDFADFGDLVNLANAAYTIPVFYGYTGGSGFPAAWYTPAQLNDMSLHLTYDQIKTNQTFKLWNKLVVDQSTHACEYEDAGTITITIEEQKDWIDGATGFYKPYAAVVS